MSEEEAIPDDSKLELTAEQSWSYVTGVLNSLVCEKDHDWYERINTGLKNCKYAVTGALRRLAKLESRPQLGPSSGGNMPCSGGEEPVLVEPLPELTDDQLRRMAESIVGHHKYSEWDKAYPDCFGKGARNDAKLLVPFLMRWMRDALESAVMADVCRSAEQCCACGNSGEALGDFQRFANCEGRPTLLCWACQQKVAQPVKLPQVKEEPVCSICQTKIGTGSCMASFKTESGIAGWTCLECRHAIQMS